MDDFGQQMRQRKVDDEKIMEESFYAFAEAVLGRSYSDTEDIPAQFNHVIEQIFSHYGCELADKIPKDITDVDEKLEYACSLSGIFRRRVYLEKGWQDDAYGDMLAFRKDNGNAVALISDGKRYKYLDAETGKMYKITKSNAGLFDPNVYLFYRPLPPGKISYKAFYRFAFSCLPKNSMVFLALVSLAITLVGLITPAVTYYLMNTVVENASYGLMLSAVFFLLSATVSSALFSFAKTQLEKKFTMKISASVSAGAMMRIFLLPPSFFRNYSSGELNEKVGYLNALTESVLSTLFQIGMTSVFSLIYIFQIATFAPSLVAPALVVIIANVAFSVLSAIILIKRQRKYMTLQAKENGIAYSMIAGVQKIKLAGARTRAYGKWARLYAESTEAIFKPVWARVFSVAVSVVGMLAIYYFAIKTGISAPSFYAFNTAYGNVTAAFAQLATIGLVIAQIKPTLEIAKPIFDTEPESSGNKNMAGDLSGSIEFESVSFKYPGMSSNILNEFSAKIKPGEYVAIVGQTGCGKSTLLRLILGFEKADTGGIFFDKQEINTVEIRSLRKNIGAVLQDGKLFSGTMEENIKISAPHISTEKVWEAAELADIADDIKRMPMGMHTLISEGSGSISGGQKQRIMIARAVASTPKILLFDEATSALDNISQKKIAEALDMLKCTRVVVAHRLSTIKNCDRILFLENGKVVEDGTYEELIAMNGRFARLVERQQV